MRENDVPISPKKYAVVRRLYQLFGDMIVYHLPYKGKDKENKAIYGSPVVEGVVKGEQEFIAGSVSMDYNTFLVAIKPIKSKFFKRRIENVFRKKYGIPVEGISFLEGYPKEEERRSEPYYQPLTARQLAAGWASRDRVDTFDKLKKLYSTQHALEKGKLTEREAQKIFNEMGVQTEGQLVGFLKKHTRILD
ncbi:MAG: hypothetical protein NTU57_03375 [Candidatus Aenigmarchaeota archaeon]|nr:hypothetical protein [Candidatus Aenigmarchaeota archaeon]